MIRFRIFRPFASSFFLKELFSYNPFFKRECEGKSRSINSQNYFLFFRTILDSLTIEKELTKLILKSGRQRYVTYTVRTKFLVIFSSQIFAEFIAVIVSDCCFKKRVQR